MGYDSICVIRMALHREPMLGTEGSFAYTPYGEPPASLYTLRFERWAAVRAALLMTRIFLTLAACSTLALFVALWLGLAIGDATVRETAVQSRVAVHFLTGVAALVLAIMVHALVITYFMGTGRWLEETCAAYHLGAAWQVTSQSLKWRLYPALVGSLVLLIATGALGGAADPASAVGFQGIGPLSAALVHRYAAIVALVVNAAVNGLEYQVLRRNGILVNDVLAQVRRIRVERGLEV